MTTSIVIHEKAFEGCACLEKINWIGTNRHIRILREIWLNKYNDNEITEIIKNSNEIEKIQKLREQQNEIKKIEYENKNEEENIKKEQYEKLLEIVI